MGQQTSLNCKSSQKPQTHEIETTKEHAIQLLKSQKNKNISYEAELKQKQSTLGQSEVVSFSPFQKINVQNKKIQLIVPQHENILKVSGSPFEGAQKIGERYVQKANKTLAEIIEERYNSNMYFPQVQVVSLIESLIYSLAYMQQFQYNHNDYYPTNIYYSNGIFKITNPLMVQASAYSLTQQRKRFSFLSPEQISDILQQVPQSQISTEFKLKSDIFSIGMILLQFCTLQPSAQCYDQQSYSLVDRIIKQRLAKVESLYSQTIADCIAEMLRYEVEQRIGVSQLSLLVFLNSSKEKMPKNLEQQSIRELTKKTPAFSAPKSYQLNPSHVQPQYLIVPQGQTSINKSPGQILPLNSNNIAIPTPNYTYSRIGPNNQCFMSSATLQNKLRVIELIHQNPKQQEQSQEHFNKFSLKQQPRNTIPEKSFIHSVNSQNNYETGPIKQSKENQAYNTHASYTGQNIQTQERGYSSQKKIYHEQFRSNIQKYNNDQAYQQKKSISSQHPQINSLLIKNSYDNSFGRNPSYSSTYATLRNRSVDQNGETLQQRVQRILQMSRSIK